MVDAGSSISWTPEYTLNFKATLEQIPDESNQIFNLLSAYPADSRLADSGLPSVHIAYNQNVPVFCVKPKPNEECIYSNSSDPVTTDKSYNFALQQNQEGDSHSLSIFLNGDQVGTDVPITDAKTYDNVQIKVGHDSSSFSTLGFFSGLVDQIAPVAGSLAGLADTFVPLIARRIKTKTSDMVSSSEKTRKYQRRKIDFAS